MKKYNLTGIDRFLQNCLMENRFPGAACYIGDLRSTFFFETYGYRQIIPTLKPMHKDTVFDLASITKPIATAVSVMKLFDEKKVRLDDRIEKYLPGFKGRPQGVKTIRQALTHTAGFPAWFPMYSIRPEKRCAFLADAESKTGKAVYSCLGFIVLGKIVEEITRLPQNIYFRDITKGFSLANTMFRPDKRRADIAATENRDRHERRKCEALGIRPPNGWRDYLIRGEVHDGNCHYGYRGVAGNAGLFSSVPDLTRFMRAYVRGEIVSPRAVNMMTANYTGGRRGRGLGWMLDIYPGSLSQKAYGHTGFTGTMICFDPLSDMLVILLTNDIHPYVKPGNMPPVRRRFMKIVSRTFDLQVNE
jgi:CubicO group peptidase (beta-lactamase class C family)